MAEGWTDPSEVELVVVLGNPMPTDPEGPMRGYPVQPVMRLGNYFFAEQVVDKLEGITGKYTMGFSIAKLLAALDEFSSDPELDYFPPDKRQWDKNTIADRDEVRKAK
jgi:hypothetical protein